MNRKLIIYFDNCIYSRIFDGKKSPTITAEAARIRGIVRKGLSGKYIIIGGGIVTTEMGRNPDVKKRRAAERLYKRIVSGEVILSARGMARAKELQSKGLKTMDARHLASAEATKADYLLTVDKDFINKCSQPNFTTVKVINPINF